MIFSADIFDDDYIPDTLLHRNRELAALLGRLNPNNSRRKTGNIVIHGPPGIGKTVLTKYFLKDKITNKNIEWTHVDCLGQTTADILRRLTRALTQRPVPPDTPIESVRRQLATAITTQTVVVLDTADDIPDTNVLNELTDIIHLSVIVICNDYDRWFDRLDDHLQSRFQTTLQPDRYSTPELTDILMARAKAGLAPNVVQEAQLRVLADGSAGMPRYAIQSLLAAAELATERGHNTIRDADIADSFRRARREVRRLTLQSLDYHHHVLYELVRTAGEISEAELSNQYQNRFEQQYRSRPEGPVPRRGQRARLLELTDYDLIEKHAGPGATAYTASDEDVRSPLVGPSGPL